MILKVPDCKRCKYYLETSLFELCTHTESTYKAGKETDLQHTIGHMRRLGCGPEARLFEVRDLTSSDSVRD